jgi:predicted nucleic acid-binding Zn ribbon protein
MAILKPELWRVQLQGVSMDKGPEPLRDVLGRLFAARGWGRRQDRLRLEDAWTAAAGPKIAAHTRPGVLRRGVLEVMVDNAVLLQELAHYQKRQLLEQLRARLPGVTLHDLRFKSGVVGNEAVERKDF